MENLSDYFTTKNALFTPSRHFHKKYLVPPDEFKTKFRPTENIALPLVVDSEYYAPNAGDFLNGEFSFRRPVTVQVKHIHFDDESIFDHYSFVLESIENGLTPRHAPTNHPFIVGDYLEKYGHKVSFERTDRDELAKREKIPKLVVVLYAYFALADIGMICPDADYQNDIALKIAYKQIKMTRRLVCGKQGAGQVNMPWLITIDGFEYQISLKIVDACAIHGIASYKEFCANSAVQLDAKDLMGNDIKRMDKVYYEKPEDYDQYSMGDLKVYDALEANAKNMMTVWEDLGIGDYYEPPKLSIGATVSELFKVKLYQLFDVTPEQARSFKGSDRDAFFENLTHKSSPFHLATLVESNAFLLVKCDGGRCKNNNPITTSATGDLVDIDISGAYSSSMSVLPFPLGNPVIYATRYNKNDRKNNSGVPLKSVFGAFKGELLDGLWYMRIDTKNLSYEQDLIGSWVDFKRTTIKRSDTDAIDGLVDVTSGFTKIFTKEIQNGCLTSDLLEVINQWNPRQRDDFFDKTQVMAIAFYPKSLQVDVETFKTTRPDRRFSTRAQDLKGFELITQDNHSWTSVPMGEFFTDIFRAKRVTHPKKSPLNTLFKLMGNTAYGCAVSRFFLTSNMIFANQITAKCRAMMYMTEKALHLHGSITDGQVFDLKKVLHRHSKRPLKTEYLSRLYAVTGKELNNAKGGKFAPLPVPVSIDGIAKTVFDDDGLKNIKTTIDQAAIDHVRGVWPESNLLNGNHKHLDTAGKTGTVVYTESVGVFEFEMKEFADQLIVQGSSNYSFDPKDKSRTKYRSYENRADHQAFEIDVDGELIELDTYAELNPAQVLLNEIATNPRAVRRLPPFIKTGILKATAYAANYSGTWKKSPLQPGDNILKIGRPAYFSTSQFTYQTAKQYDSWKKTGDKLKRKYGESYEIFFSNPDGTVDFLKMITTIDKMIREGVTDPMKQFDPHWYLTRITPHHCITTIKNTADALRSRVSSEMLFDGSDEDDEWEFIETSDRDE